ncbi:TPA: conjugal transfer protein TraL [Vibrio vulnificus]|uniref:conjugal transfer protein TraL n=1 Tax=Vibrio TaxID=662 RepID=UPI00190929AB|nr:MULTISPECIES: conjugal transfer protein TraL [Vibrio]HAS6415145.1 conjugal transfer protein TraL [Vibrio vulnificus]HDM8224978.1 conjugal transfer protein TraL [Vibrio campbellii]EGQ8549995.1 conjugal transfer protein TraL [Vibrio parahaemolyticus]EJB8449479.1 conjugal transfer protein TraL [Vibrio parahaemolyticus]ELZ7233996.1 conjugal transfer protein TraL [Vibrio parahaemolyticus]
MTKKLLLFALSLGILLPTLTLSPTAYAASDAECSIWLCLPTGFPSGCGDAKSAFKKRIKKFKPPLPSFTGCLLKDSPKTSTMDAKDGYAALMPEKRVCNSWEQRRSGGEWERYCTGYKTIPTHVIKNTRCYSRWRDGERITNPSGCSRTIRYVDTYMDGKTYGETHYFDNNGNDISIPSH